MAKNWAIAIGINKYSNLTDLKYAKGDAEAVKNLLLSKAGFDRVFLFTDDSPEIPAKPSPIYTQPTFGHLRRFLRAQFSRRILKPGDNLWFFFAGHGRREANRDYLMLYDSDPGDVEHTAIPVHYVTEQLCGSGADNVVLFLDACRDVGARGEGIGEEHRGVVTFYSCAPNQQSYEIEALQQGAFTYALIEALQIQGAGNCATVERLEQYLSRRVPEINRQYPQNQGRQTPYAIPEPASKLHLILLPKYATLADVATLKIDAFRAEYAKDYETARQLWIQVNIAAGGSDMDAIEAIGRFRTWFVQPSSPSPRQRQPAPLQPEPVTTLSGVRSSTPEPEVELLSEQVFEFDVVTVNAEGREVKREKGQAQYFAEDLGNGVALEMVAIPGGKFLMGTEDSEIERLFEKFNWEGFRREKPQHEVTLQPFFIGKYPVTQAQWKAIASRSDLKVEHDLKPNPSNFKGDKRPVEQVSWHEAVEFCARLSKKTGREYRLPSEAEWEYACRAGTTTPFYFGETITGELANYRTSETYAEEPKGEYRQETTPVGSFPPNAFGLYDMHGQVWEWCADTWHENYNGAPTDGIAWITGGDDNRSPLREYI